MGGKTKAHPPYPQVDRLPRKNSSAIAAFEFWDTTRTTTHYLYSGASTDDLVKAVDSEWAGPLPHTVVISPSGQILYRHNGLIDPAKLLDVVLGAFGTYYQP